MKRKSNSLRSTLLICASATLANLLRPRVAIATTLLVLAFVYYHRPKPLQSIEIARLTPAAQDRDARDYADTYNVNRVERKSKEFGESVQNELLPEASGQGDTFEIAEEAEDQIDLGYSDNSAEEFVAEEAPRTFLGQSCRKWAVVSTANPPTESVRRFMYMPGWCVVVVAADQADRPYHFYTSMGANLIYLSPADQGRIGSELVDRLPWTAMSRKNVGYLYAMAHGAEVIWDFEDGNALKFWIEHASPDRNLVLDHFANRTGDGVLSFRMPKTSDKIFNPLPPLGYPVSQSHPRGFCPSNPNSTSRISYSTITPLSWTQIGVLQSLADHNADLPGQQRTRPLDFNQNGQLDEPLLLPPGLYSPYNAQATLHFRPAFHALFLPASVPHAMADVWRSYIAQALFDVRGLQVGFLPRPLVTQERPAPGPDQLRAEADFCGKLLELLITLEVWKKEVAAVRGGYNPQVVRSLWERLGAVGLVSQEDVADALLWLDTINQIQHQGHGQARFNFQVGQAVAKKVTGEPEECLEATATRRTFFTADLHRAIRMEMPASLSYLKQNVILGGRKNLLFKSSILKYPGVSSFTPLPPMLEDHRHSDDMSLRELDEGHRFFAAYKELAGVDAFFCSFPATLCEMWLPFNKSIVISSSHRYNMGRCSKESWIRWTDKLTRLSDDRRHSLGALSRYDVEYLRYYTGFQHIRLIPSYSGFYSKGKTYKPKHNLPVLVIRQRHNENMFPHYVTLLESISKFKWDGLYDLYPKGYGMVDLARHPAVVVLTYAVMSFRIVECYTLNIPIFIPSLKYFRANGGLGHDRTITSEPWCVNKSHLNHEVRRHPDVGLHPYSPNTERWEDEEAEMYWMQYADYYDWPHIQLFHDVHDLEAKMAEANLREISARMKEENEIRRRLHLQGWCQALLNIPAGKM